ncbi:response regulator [Pontibacter chitinilyticus]|uniref:response regulator n=1 Tax=Pontibacter chitinilyticus TaxID=2674989 RepID=UPI00321BCC23
MQPQTILLIDDDEIANFLHEKLLNDSGLVKKVYVTINGLDGINFLRQLTSIEEYPHFILLDIKMPVMDGFSFLEEYFKIEGIEQAPTKVHILSTSSSPLDLKRIRKFGINSFLEKPLTAAHVQELVAQ